MSDAEASAENDRSPEQGEPTVEEFELIGRLNDSVLEFIERHPIKDIEPEDEDERLQRVGFGLMRMEFTGIRELADGSGYVDFLDEIADDTDSDLTYDFRVVDYKEALALQIERSGYINSIKENERDLKANPDPSDREKKFIAGIEAKRTMLVNGILSVSLNDTEMYFDCRQIEFVNLETAVIRAKQYALSPH